MEIILTPFVWLLQVFYDWCGSYGLALILFAIVVKLILFPFSLKGKRSMIQMNMLSGKMNKLQKQYGKNIRTRSAIIWRFRSSMRRRRSTPWGAVCGPSFPC